MKSLIGFLMIILITVCSCDQAADTSKDSTSATTPGGQEKVNDTTSQKDIVKVAISSKDHTTLVKALQKADLVTSLSNAGPFTVFAPTNEAFDKLPKGTLDDLMTDEKKEQLQDILQYHVTLSAMNKESFTDGQTLGMVNGDNVTVSVKDGKVMLNNSATIIASVRASNGVVHIIDGVLLPPAKK
jgi:uncharacterized surface protein with fasciclin (FAS1) repeats